MGEPLMTSLQEIARYSPCNEGWVALLDLLGEPYEHGRCKIRNSKDWATPFKVSEIGKLGNIVWLCWTSRLFENNPDTVLIYDRFSLWCSERSTSTPACLFLNRLVDLGYWLTVAYPSLDEEVDQLEKLMEMLDEGVQTTPTP